MFFKEEILKLMTKVVSEKNDIFNDFLDYLVNSLYKNKIITSEDEKFTELPKVINIIYGVSDSYYAILFEDQQLLASLDYLENKDFKKLGPFINYTKMKLLCNFTFTLLNLLGFITEILEIEHKNINNKKFIKYVYKSLKMKKDYSNKIIKLNDEVKNETLSLENLKWFRNLLEHKHLYDNYDEQKFNESYLIKYFIDENSDEGWFEWVSETKNISSGSIGVFKKTNFENYYDAYEITAIIDVEKSRENIFLQLNKIVDDIKNKIKV